MPRPLLKLSILHWKGGRTGKNKRSFCRHHCAGAKVCEGSDHAIQLVAVFLAHSRYIAFKGSKFLTYRIESTEPSIGLYSKELIHDNEFGERGYVLLILENAHPV